MARRIRVSPSRFEPHRVSYNHTSKKGRNMSLEIKIYNQFSVQYQLPSLRVLIIATCGVRLDICNAIPARAKSATEPKMLSCQTPQERTSLLYAIIAEKATPNSFRIIKATFPPLLSFLSFLCGLHVDCCIEIRPLPVELAVSAAC